MRALRPKVRRMLADGASRARVTMHLAYWRLRYRLTSLRLVGDGQIVARLNPRSRMRLRKIPPGELGRILRPALEAAQRQYIADVRAQRLAGEATPLQEAQRRARGTSPADELLDEPGRTLSRAQRQAVLTPDRPLAQLVEVERALGARGRGRRVRISEPSQIHGTRRFAAGVSVTQHARHRGVGSTRVNLATRLTIGGRTFAPVRDVARGGVPGLGEALAAVASEFGIPEGDLARVIAAPTTLSDGDSLGRQEHLLQALGRRIPESSRDPILNMIRAASVRDDLEAGRNLALGPANAVTRLLGQADEIGIADQYTRGSAFSPASRGQVSSSNARLRARALVGAEADIGRIFQQLERSVTRVDIFRERTGFDPRPLLRAVRRYLRAQRRELRTKRDRRTLVRALNSLVDRLLEVLRLYD